MLPLASSPSLAPAMKLPRPPHIHKAVLCLSLLSLFLFFHGWRNLSSQPKNQLSWSNRRALASKYDFTPFLHHSQRQRHHHHHIHHQRGHVPVVPGPPDPYGAEKRLVPTGPNPLHH
ncbi:hypothetical protein BT93_L5670 [Corymbia citriodora subsp. variegata]|uniref:CLAVATA3/ESR (CLE)-related protein 13 n=1 Tax=Corymbia citriodora subsp. variegata TaxID=360336 RepID=A0A8T0CRI1_CORYI|nr:hypothetical protein BT93_L5670 [Corymbia citriodora subsp. variegata]